MFDAKTFKETFLPYHGHLYRTAYRLLNNQADAEDIVQDVYVRLWNMKDKFHEVNNFQAYATTMTRNMCIDKMRSPAYRTSNTGVTEALKYEWTDAVEQIDQKDELKMVIRLVEQLPQRQKEIFRLRHFNEFSLDEIGKITGLSPVNIRVQLTRAQKKLREQYEKMNRYENR
ncbi:MAG: sigma-70 family RNA polymerase sigma factor [Bacteroidales bacterium]|jgi:RNA polymerase sigma-70 factor (ECF subfamily)|nr:sigma-70 family RNA polymerase sigma factor [Bacteroidales bacterium]MDD2264541.1 sigma-70 family RNA polymerase sigma factor [Bacteroidales bacterium]MDD2831776.1 sigma-70 family RNA polymerase sigma factor [Bacteroidales bacterium]MDD3209420.1 sigma-70 family RNA polymerase sigma factor [Bacteroidales bacterium]MDD3697774.1 sigma-70 family RNA polymerase sigma factor [Bacteroidales bacterium]